jgi:hypothetical protein
VKYRVAPDAIAWRRFIVGVFSETKILSSQKKRRLYRAGFTSAPGDLPFCPCPAAQERA